MTELPALDAKFLPRVDPGRLELAAPSTYPPRILLLYGSLRARSFSRLLVEEAARILQALGCASTVTASGRLMGGFRST